MGFESFRVELNGGSSTLLEAADAILALEHARRDDEAAFMPDQMCYLVRDTGYAIELELMDSPVTISCRFALCHPPSVDAALFELVRKLMIALNMQVTICEDVLPQHDHPFSLDQFEEFTQAYAPSVAARRREWKAMFGNKLLAATTAEAHQHIILPHCVPSVDKAG